MKWKTAIHDKGWSSPVIWGNQAWLTTATDKADHEAIAEQGRLTVRAGYAELDASLAGRRFAQGASFSVIDAMLVVHYRWGNRCAIDMRHEYPNFAALVDGLRAIPAVARVIAREGIQID